MCRNLEVARRDTAIRDMLVGILEDRIAGSDKLSKTKRVELRGQLKDKPGLFRYLRTIKSGMCVSTAARSRPRSSWTASSCCAAPTPDLDAAEVARGYKALADVERGWRDLKQLDLRPVYHRLEHRIIGHVQLCWLCADSRCC